LPARLPILDARPTAPLPPWALAGVLLQIVAIVLVATFSYRALVNRSDAARRTMQTLAVLNDLSQLQQTLLDAETGLRGYVLSKDERYLQPFVTARQELPGTLRTLDAAFADDPEQRRRLHGIDTVARELLAQMERAVVARPAGAVDAGVSDADLARVERAKSLSDRLRAAIAEMRDVEQRALTAREAAWESSRIATTAVTWGGSGLLLVLVLATGYMMSRDHRARETESWMRGGVSRLRDTLQGDRSLGSLGQGVADFLAEFLRAQVATVYVSRPDGRFERVAAYALPASASPDTLQPGDGLLGEAARGRRVVRVPHVPDGYLTVGSSVGRAAPRELVLLPATVGATVHAVIELGFFRRVTPADLEFLSRCADALGAAVRAARDRSRLEELLEETQRQAEELQTQQEELRVNNEELEEHARALKESQARLETQQAELEQTNASLEAQTQLLEDQKALLAESQRSLAARAAELTRSNQYKSALVDRNGAKSDPRTNSSLMPHPVSVTAQTDQPPSA
jgi:CHASE3 domain sensor protein